MLICSICGSNEFRDAKILWPELIEQWEISPEETAYIDRQQGTHCTRCSANLRGVALGRSLQAAFQTKLSLVDFIECNKEIDIRLLDLNGTSPSDTLSKMPRYVRADYPDIDMQSLPYDAGSFDIVIHSDTLEHVPDPIKAIAECRRVLTPGGVLCFTVPTIVGRLSRSREGMAPSYHGNPTVFTYDFVVHTEFGADAWAYVIRAGFADVQIHTVEFPTATAISARK